jgi:hypothetical protein
MPSEAAGQDHVRIAAGDEGEVAPDLLPTTSMVQPPCAGVVLAGREHGPSASVIRSATSPSRTAETAAGT